MKAAGAVNGSEKERKVSWVPDNSSAFGGKLARQAQ